MSSCPCVVCLLIHLVFGLVYWLFFFSLFLRVLPTVTHIYLLCYKWEGLWVSHTIYSHYQELIPQDGWTQAQDQHRALEAADFRPTPAACQGINLRECDPGQVTGAQPLSNTFVHLSWITLPPLYPQSLSCFSQWPSPSNTSCSTTGCHEASWLHLPQRVGDEGQYQ